MLEHSLSTLTRDEFLDPDVLRRVLNQDFRFLLALANGPGDGSGKWSDNYRESLINKI